MASLSLLYLFLSVVVFPAALFWSPDTGYKFLQLQSLHWDGGLDDSIAYPGRDLDPQLQLLPFGDPFVDVRADGTIHLVWPPLFALLCLPFFRILGSAGLHVLPALAGAGAAALAGLLARRIAGGGFAMAAALAGLATPLFCYSLLFWEHTPATLLSTLGVLLLLRTDDGDRFSWSSAAAGCAFAAACALRSEVLLLLLAVALVWLAVFRGSASRWSAGWTVAGAFVVTSAPIWLYQWATTGHALPVSTVHRFAGLNLAHVLGAPQRLIPDVLVGDNLPSVLAAAFSLAAAATLAFSWSGRGRAGAAAFRVGLASMAVIGVLILAWTGPRFYGLSAFHGMLAVAPVVVLGLCRPYGPAVGAPGEAPYRFLAWATVVYAVLYSFSAVFTENGGLEWGPRFFLPGYPLLAALVAGWWQRRNGSFRRGSAAWACIVALALLSHSFQARGAVAIGASLRRQLGVNRAIAAIPDGTPLVATRWWMPTMVTGSYRRLPTFHVENKTEFERWAAAAAAHGLDGFWLLGVDPGSPSELDSLLQPPWPDGTQLRPEAPLRVSGLTLTRIAILPPRQG